MSAESLLADVEAYQSVNEQEEADQAVMVRLLREDPHCFERSALAHFTTSVWTVDPMRTQTLLVYHNIY